MMFDDPRPLGRRAYGSIPHLPGSRTGPSDRTVPPGQADICLCRGRDRHDEVIVQEKLDGSCVAVARIAGQILALGREGRLAQASPNPGRQQFARWVQAHHERFEQTLADGERWVGEWLGLAHSTRYDLPHDPWVAFDLIVDGRRLTYDAVVERAARAELVTPHLVHRGRPLGVEAALAALGEGGHGARDPVEGAVWRVERKGEVDIVAKYVRPGKVDGMYLPEHTGEPAIYNWRAPSEDQ